LALDVNEHSNDRRHDTRKRENEEVSIRTGHGYLYRRAGQDGILFVSYLCDPILRPYDLSPVSLWAVGGGGCLLLQHIPLPHQWLNDPAYEYTGP
jgi:hypothetical protein